MTWVLKIGGSVRDPDAILREVAARDERIVIVHGGSRDLDELSARCGAMSRIVESERGEVSRYTDAATMDLFLMAYAGKTNKRFVERLRQLGCNAIGLCGLDGGVVQGRRRADLRIREEGRVKVLHDNHVGIIERVDARLLSTLLEAGYTPVLCPPISAEDGTAINVDGDKLAAEVAVALRAERLFIFADTPGVLRDVTDQASLIGRVGDDEAPALLVSITGRARVKLRAATDARRRGVTSVVLTDGRGSAPLGAALAGAGTRLS